MSPVLFFYLADAVTSLNSLAQITFFGLITSVLGVAFKNSMNDESKNTPPYIKIVLPYIIGAAILLVFIPSRQTMYLMAAANVVTDIASNERVKSLADNSLTLIEDKIKEYSLENKPKETK